MRLIYLTFWGLTALFVLLLNTNTHPFLRSGFLFFVAAFFILGFLLIYLSIKQKIVGKLRFSLILTGGSAVLFVISVLVHNFFSAIFQVEDVLFFIIAVIACPVGFLVGFVGSVAGMIARKA